MVNAVTQLSPLGFKAPETETNTTTEDAILTSEISNATLNLIKGGSGGASGLVGAYKTAQDLNDQARVTNQTSKDVENYNAKKNPPIPANIMAAADLLSKPTSALFSGDNIATKTDLEKISRAEKIEWKGITYTPSKDEVIAAKSLLENYDASGGKGKGSLLDKILQDGMKKDKFSLESMQKTIAENK